MKSVTTIAFDDRKATIKERIAEYERTWDTFVSIISRLFYKSLQKVKKSKPSFPTTVLFEHGREYQEQRWHL